MWTGRGLGSSGGAGGSVVIGPCVPRFETFLLHNGESEEGRLPEYHYGPGVGNQAQTDIVDLETAAEGRVLPCVQQVCLDEVFKQDMKHSQDSLPTCILFF